MITIEATQLSNPAVEAVVTIYSGTRGFILRPRGDYRLLVGHFEGATLSDLHFTVGAGERLALQTADQNMPNGTDLWVRSPDQAGVCELILW